MEVITTTRLSKKLMGPHYAMIVSTILVRRGAEGVDEVLDAGLEDVAGMVIPQIVSCADMAE